MKFGLLLAHFGEQASATAVLQGARLAEDYGFDSVKVTKLGFVLGTVIPGLLPLGLFAYWVADGNPIGWDHTSDPAVATVPDGHAHPRYFPHFAGLGSLSFLASILLLFAGVEVQAVHADQMKDPRRGFPSAMFLAAAISFGIFTLGALAIAGILPYDRISLQSGVFDASTASWTASSGSSWLIPIVAALVCYGALGGALAWLGGPSKALLATARHGLLPPFLQRTTARGVQRNILLVQGVIVTAISSIYLLMDNVSTAFFLISAITVSLYIIMYVLLYAAAIRLRRTRPDLERTFKIPGGDGGMWAVAGVGFLAVAFAFVVSFVPPSQLPIGSPGPTSAWSPRARSFSPARRWSSPRGASRHGSRPRPGPAPARPSAERTAAPRLRRRG